MLVWPSDGGPTQASGCWQGLSGGEGAAHRTHAHGRWSFKHPALSNTTNGEDGKAIDLSLSDTPPLSGRWWEVDSSRWHWIKISHLMWFYCASFLVHVILEKKRSNNFSPHMICFSFKKGHVGEEKCLKYYHISIWIKCISDLHYLTLNFLFLESLIDTV